MTRGYFQKWKTNAQAEMKKDGHKLFTATMETRKNIESCTIAKNALRLTETKKKSLYELFMQENPMQSALDELLAEQQANLPPAGSVSTQDWPGLTLDDFPELPPGELLF
ncbi:hypothetical protein TKK_0005309 [Trichogramma kaykai]